MVGGLKPPQLPPHDVQDQKVGVERDLFDDLEERDGAKDILETGQEGRDVFGLGEHQVGRDGMGDDVCDEWVAEGFSVARESRARNV